ncbi:uncharacterized protein UV8b_06431 [Ustilaginoidea virens]|nr:uncharacterized protein UV8b_06431 [Ustilaginoidea virens]QUC22190.1 hypothetical protein UV8b_06431 [Ustilaginoidea virens]
MKSKSALAGLVTSGILLLLQSSPVCQAAVLNPPHQSASSSGNPSNISRFPMLTRICDGALEFFWGRRRLREGSNQSPTYTASRATYANQVVLRFNITDDGQEAVLAAAASRLFLDVWALTTDFVDIRLHREEVPSLMGLLPSSLQAASTTLISDLASAVYNSVPHHDRGATAEADDLSLPRSLLAADSDNIFFQDYQPLPVIVRWMRLLEAMFPSFVEYISIGKSFEGRDISALRLRVSPVSVDSGPRKTIVVTGGLHAREWISTSTVNYLAWSFIMSFGNERMITNLLHEFDMVFVPVVNPDGMEYSWRVDRLWRKSRQQTSLRYCPGFDLDHTFGYGRDGPQSQAQADPCSESYGGEEPFQAVEARELAAWARNETLNKIKFVGLLDLHSYSQQILFPFTFSCQERPPNLESLEELAAGIAKAIRIANGESYSVSSACEVATTATEGRVAGHQSAFRIESGGGSAIDWFYHELNAHFSYQLKLRDTGSYGFLLPKEYIVPTGEEVFSALKSYGDYLLGNNGIERLLDDEESDFQINATSSDATLTTNQELRRRRL